MALSKNDEIFLGVLKETGHIMPFLDAVFGFLYRCTDFYQIQEDGSSKLGFPPGVAEKCVLKTLRKWEQQARQDEQLYNKSRMSSAGDVPPAVEEVETEREPVERPERVKRPEPANQSTASNRSAAAETSGGDSYNGAVRDKYRWSQTISDVDVQVPVPQHVRKARDVQVKITATSMSVAVAGAVLVEGELSERHNKEESLWSLEPGQHVQVHLEKSQERWWDRLLVSEPCIDLSHIDASRPMQDLAQDEQMKIQELVWNQERKRLGLPTSDQLAAEKILKEAWNKEGSPFLGTEYDPSVINFSNSSFPEAGDPA